MNNQIVLQDVVSMTSREIATLVESRHANVKRSIERLMTNAVISKAPTEFLEEISNLGLPTKREVYIFSGEQGKRDSIIVVAQLSPLFTAKLVDRWMELEAERTKAMTPYTIDPTRDALIRALIDADRLEQRQIQLAAQQAELTMQQQITAVKLDHVQTRVDSLIGGDDYTTAKGFSRSTGYPGDRDSLNALGRRCAKMCRAEGHHIGKVRDEVWGEVNSYPREILERAARAL